MHIVWGLAFIALFALPPVLAWLVLPRSVGQIALWAEWLIITLSWQIGDSPVDGEKVTFGLFLSWLAWVAALAGPLVLAARSSARQSAPPPEQAAATITTPGPQTALKPGPNSSTTTSSLRCCYSPISTATLFLRCCWDRNGGTTLR